MHRVIINLNELRLIEHQCNTPEDVNMYVHRYPTDASAPLHDYRNTFYGVFQNAPTLGLLIIGAIVAMPFGEGVFFCRERAIFAHVILASMGIPSIIVSADDNNGNRHVFVKFWHKRVAKILDPQQRYLPTNINPDAYNGYVHNVSVQVLVEPNNVLEGYSRP